MADVVESLEVGWVRGPPKAVGAFRFFLNLGRVDGFGLDGNGRRAKREPEHVSFVRTVHSVLRWGGLRKLLFWDNRCFDLLIGVGLGGDPLRAAFDPAISAIYG